MLITNCTTSAAVKNPINKLNTTLQLPRSLVNTVQLQLKINNYLFFFTFSTVNCKQCIYIAPFPPKKSTLTLITPQKINSQ